MFRSIKAINHPHLLRIAAFLGAGLFLLVLISTLIFPLPLGLADNHDYWRLMDPFGLAYPDTSGIYYYTHICLVFIKSLPWRMEIVSSGTVFVGLAYAVTWFLHWPVFPLLMLGLVHCMFYAWAYFLFIKNAHHKTFFAVIIFAVISLLFLSDILFTAYFNSFYQESATFIFLLFFVALFQSKKVHFWWEWLMVIGLALSKISNVSFLLLFGLLLVKYWQRAGRALKTAAVIFACCLVLGIQNMSQGESNSPNVFNSFFQGLIRNQDSTQILHDFHLDMPIYYHYVGQDFWHAIGFSDQVKKDFYGKVTHGKIIEYYFTHPGIVLEKGLELIHQLVSEPRPDNLGNRSKEFLAGFVLETNITSFWQKILPFILLPGLLWSFIQSFVLWRRKYGWTSEGLLLIALPFFLPLQLMISFVGDGWNEFAKHNVTFYFVFVIWLLITWQFWYKHFEAKKL